MHTHACKCAHACIDTLPDLPPHLTSDSHKLGHILPRDSKGKGRGKKKKKTNRVKGDTHKNTTRVTVTDATPVRPAEKG